MLYYYLYVVETVKN